MIFYHGTQNKDLKELTLEHSSGKIYLTDSFEFAFMYAACPLRFWGYDKANDKLILREVVKDCFKKQFSGVKCYVFSCEIDDFEKVNSRSNHTFLSHKIVKLNPDCEVIEDAYEKLMELFHAGRIELRFWKDYSKDEKTKVFGQFVDGFRPHLKESRENFPKEFAMLVKLNPNFEKEVEK